MKPAPLEPTEPPDATEEARGFVLALMQSLGVEVPQREDEPEENESP